MPLENREDIDPLAPQTKDHAIIPDDQLTNSRIGKFRHDPASAGVFGQ